MIVGMTYDLIDDYLALGWSREAAAEFDPPETVDALAEAIEEQGHTVRRIGNLQELVRHLARGERWDLVFNIAEGASGFGREAQVPAVLEGFGIPYTFSDPLTLAVALHKGMAKHVVRGCGVPTADFVVLESPQEATAVDLEPPLFVKPVAEGTGKGIDGASLVEEAEALAPAVAILFEEFGQPVLVERYLSGAEYTVGIVGTGAAARSLGVMRVRFLAGAEGGGYSYFNKANYEKVIRYEMVTGPEATAAEQIALAAWRALNCRDAGRVDLRADAAGRLHFLEVNPLAGLNPHHSDLPIMCRLQGVPYRELIAMILDACCHRIGVGEPRSLGLVGAARAGLQ